MAIGPVAVLEPASAEMRARIETLCHGFDLRFVEGSAVDDFIRAVDGAEYVVTRGLRFPPEALEAARALKLIHQWGTGTDGIPLDAARARGIQVARSPGMNAPTVAEATLALMLATLRQLPQVHNAFRAGQWDMPDLWRQARDLSACRVGLIGMGAIAQEVVIRLRGFGCPIAYTRASGPDAALDLQYLPLDELLANSDIVSLHLPLTDQTRHLMNTDAIAQLPQGSILINTSRGGLVDETALLTALERGHLAGAGLDVFEGEPVTRPGPLLSHPATVTLPHVAGRTLDNFDRMVRHWAGNIRKHATGAPIDPECIVLG
ncbi:2-hydroxyacid dehydrogenase [Pseudooceanicola sp. C21-150M6]|uniref:2-hydroxyacid dehydrogenase n=1 Tax=Pseudooceanicola sp. C21-150M6 TaxID=3434355 RepID=UPI003D7F875F